MLSRKMKKIIKLILAAAGTLIFLGGISLFWVGYSFNKALEPKVDSSLYSGIVQERIESSDHYDFLPPHVPEDATQVSFFHIPGFLQGGDVIVLRVSLSDERTLSVLKDLEASGRKEITTFEGIPAPRSYPEYGLKTPGPKNLYEGVSELPTDFRVFLYKSDLDDIKKQWNHNILSFTAVSTQRNEIVYYIDNW